MAAYTDYTFYNQTYRGVAITQDAFPRLAMRASEVIDALTFDRTAAVITANTDTATIEKVKMATCAVAEQMLSLENSGGAVSSEHVGNYSVNYITQLSEDARLKKAAKRYLSRTFLMFPGFNSDEGGDIEGKTNLNWQTWP
jgi:hypothetical protein